MLTLKRLELDGFGPFIDGQTLEFPSEPGVTVIYGENMRGKTTLLNAIRYAFFGSALARGSRTRKLHTISNRERAANGQFGFDVVLRFDYDGTEYELARTCTPRVASPTVDADYSQHHQLKRERSVLGPQERDRALEMIFPSEISRFFLFDGELLQEYEELLINESEAGRRISEAIEKILGMPILKRGRAHLVHLYEEAEKLAAREAMKHKETQAVGAALEQATEQRAEHQKEIRRLESDLEELISQRSELESYLKANENHAALLQDLENANERLAQVERLEVRRRGDLQRAMGDAWRTILRQPVRAARQAANRVVQDGIDSLIAQMRAEAIESGHCRTCDQDVPPSVQKRLAQTSSVSGELTSEGVARTVAVANSLDQFDDSDNSQQVQVAARELNDLAIERVTLDAKIKDLKRALADADAARLRDAATDFAEVIEKIGIVRTGLGDERSKVEALDNSIQRLKKQLEGSADSALQQSQTRARVLRESANVLDLAVEAYKADLRTKVETTASDLFLAMTTERTDYAGLTINEGYGLTIRHKDGRAEEARSAGAEHVVALALMGALQHNAPLRGPIVMDSPFGRLDEGHTENVVRALPQMADQIVLLVYKAEVGRDRMRDLLGPALLREYELERVSARRTEVREVR